MLVVEMSLLWHRTTDADQSATLIMAGITDPDYRVSDAEFSSRQEGQIFSRLLP